ncbi:MAG TPA: cytochrome c peroxidase [Terriglobales bacterium]|nr:cytochrome c peroxidase [Terriglobales bacterium]
MNFWSAPNFAAAFRMTLILFTLNGFIVAQSAISKNAFKLPMVPQPADNKMTAERVHLGKMLFFDPRLSGERQMSCATCHDPMQEWSDGLPTAIGHNHKTLRRATPSLLNTGFNHLQMWDGRFHSLEEQVLGPLQSTDEMDSNMAQVLDLLRSIPEYTKAFDKAYAGAGVNQATLAKAIASFERTLILRQTPFDRWVEGNDNAISVPAKRGFNLFIGKANCVVCHQAPNFTDEGFHNIGLENNQDVGRYAVVPIKVTKGGFKTPSLRGVSLTAPYMHDGRYKTLEEVIDHYDRGGDDKQNLDPNIKPLNLTAQEKIDLLQFLNSLSSRLKPMAAPTLPGLGRPTAKDRL